MIDDLLGRGYTGVTALAISTTAVDTTKARLGHVAPVGRRLRACGRDAGGVLAGLRARETKVAVVAMVSNAVDHAGEQFDTGSSSMNLAS